MLRKIVTDDEERHDVWFALVHAWAFDVASRTETRMAAVRTAATPLGHSADGGLLQRSFPPVLGCQVTGIPTVEAYRAGWPLLRTEAETKEALICEEGEI